MSARTELLALLAANGLGTVNTDLFAGYLPPINPKATNPLFECIALIPSPGFPDGIDGSAAFGGQFYDLHTLQLFSRSDAADRAEGRALAAFKVFGDVSNELLSGVQYAKIERRQPPYLLERDTLGAVTFAFNVIAWRAAVQASDYSVFL
jgi:hypothetical protein